MNKGTLYGKIVVNLLIGILGLLGIIFFVPKLLGFFMPFVIGWGIALLCNPLVKFLESKVKMVRKFSSVLIIVVVLATVVLTIYVVLARLVEQAVSFVQNINDVYMSLENAVNNLATNLGDNYSFLPEKVVTGMQNFLFHLDDYMKVLFDKIQFPSLSSASGVVKSIGNGFFMFFITTISAYFFIAEKDLIVERLKNMMSLSARNHFTLITNNFKMAIGGYFKAQFKIMLVIVVILFFGFWMIHVEYALLLAFGIALLDFLPVFGTGTVIWPWALVDVVNGNYSQAIILLVLYIICQVIKQVLQPKMVGDSIGLSPLMTLVFLYIGYQIAGVLGIILGIPVGMIVVNLYRAGAFDTYIRGLKIIIHDINEFRKF